MVIYLLNHLMIFIDGYNMNKRLTIKEAQSQGFIIDTCCYPYIGYKGPRMQPTTHVEVFTEMETEALDRLEDMYRSDDGQAWKEAEVFLRKCNRTKYL